ncbi:hypothetical protein HMPREF9946_04428 [Acetobacteraceae bacterium AT-5844]|nr:hypothetical protein HMPREF9946_04428 [Acetobacteraceae bacterium AT-5844]
MSGRLWGYDCSEAEEGKKSPARPFRPFLRGWGPGCGLYRELGEGRRLGKEFPRPLLFLRVWRGASGAGGDALDI